MTDGTNGANGAGAEKVRLKCDVKVHCGKLVPSYFHCRGLYSAAQRRECVRDGRRCQEL